MCPRTGQPFVRHSSRAVQRRNGVCCVFSDGPVAGKRLLVHGVLGAVGSMAAQLARWKGATVVGTVRHTEDVDQVNPTVCEAVIALDGANPVRAVRDIAPDGVDRVIEVSLSDNIDFDMAVVANDAVVAAYASRLSRPEVPFWPLLFANTTLRMRGSDDFSKSAKVVAAQELTAASSSGVLLLVVAARYELADIALAHDQVDASARGRILLTHL